MRIDGAKPRFARSAHGFALGMVIESHTAMGFLYSKLKQRHIWKRIFIERLAEPLHLNLLSLPVAAFGSLRSKVEWDLIVRHEHAFSLLKAADWAKECGMKSISVIEFGVANGAGLMNLCKVAQKVAKATGVEFELFGFDSGEGMPEPIDYRDHPEYYNKGDFHMENREALLAHLPSNAHIIFGDISETVVTFSGPPVGFISIDVDYYHSTRAALKVLTADPSGYLPWVVMYFDDILFDRHNPSCGELAAVAEFNCANAKRKIYPMQFFRSTRIFQRARWINQIFVAHILDHPFRQSLIRKVSSRILENPYLTMK